VIPRLHLILDLATLAPNGRDPLAVAVAAARGGVDAVHLRAPGHPAGKVLALAHALREALPPAVLLLVNDRLDVALAVASGGVQLPESGLAPAVARLLAARAGRHARDFLVGCSAHSAAVAAEAERDGADFVLLGTVFASASHPGAAPGGEALVRATHAATRLPLIAIGGITPENAPRTLAAGATGVAAIRSIVEAPDPQEAASALHRAIEPACSYCPAGNRYECR
jgi:thiazole tautomerase (transcriptional regulator TenI)